MRTVSLQLSACLWGCVRSSYICSTSGNQVQVNVDMAIKSRFLDLIFWQICNNRALFSSYDKNVYFKGP